MVIEQSDDEKQGKSLKEFDKTYRRTTATFWYTEESPVYKNLNEVLHIQNIDGVKPFASFIKYLNAQLDKMSLPIEVRIEIVLLMAKFESVTVVRRKLQVDLGKNRSRSRRPTVINDTLENYPGSSFRFVAQDSSIPQTTTYRIMTEHLLLKPYKVQFVQ
ncbi:unnamed protein product [Adineta ricciae]|uniref:Uncharacterized protein n=1 Tax=Adineta ricciae TaxID=249248 RepID=A0A813UN31_ADIRI|nr:unnamed protein product [Adineta ricciae]